MFRASSTDRKSYTEQGTKQADAHGSDIAWCLRLFLPRLSRWLVAMSRASSLTVRGEKGPKVQRDELSKHYIYKGERH